MNIEIKNVRTLYHENSDYRCDWKSIGQQYIFVYFHTPVLLSYDDKKEKTQSGTFILYDKFSPKKYSADGIELVHDWMRFDGDLTEVISELSFDFNRPYIVNSGDFITKIMQEIENEFVREDKYSSGISCAKVLELLFKISRNVDNQNKAPLDVKTEKLLMDIRTKMYHDCGENWNVEQMARDLHFSASRFHALYKAQFGVSPKQDLQQIRINYAQNLLAQENITVSEVAEFVGYKNEYYFIKKFKKVFGKTPGRYKKDIQKSAKKERRTNKRDCK